MPTQTFSITPSSGASLTVKPSVDVVKFGDGYEQRIPSGINSQPRKWALEFRKGTLAKCQDVKNFLDARGGKESFYWTPPIGAQGVFVCREWSVTLISPTLWNISAIFEEVFA